MEHGRSQPESRVIHLTRAYAAPAAADGVRVLVDRLWPRGVAKTEAKLDAWMGELGPSDALRTWFGHQPDRWATFAARYRDELTTPMRQALLAALDGVAAGAALTLVYGARDTRENEAVVLRQYLLHERPASPWDAPTTLLVLVAAVAAAHRDAVAPVAGVKLFASSLVTGEAFADAVQTLLAGSQVRSVAGGWQLTTRARQQVHRLAQRDATAAVPV